MPRDTASPPLICGPGRVKAVFAADVALAWRQILENLKSRSEGPSVVTISWQQVPELERELDSLVDAMAEAALSIWPHWYCSADERFVSSDAPTPNARAVVLRAQARAVAHSEAWVRLVWKRCERHKLPKTKRLPNAEQVRHLSRAIDPFHLIIVVAAYKPVVKKGRLQALTKALEWMAKETDTPLVFVAPTEWRARPELDAVTYDSITWSDLEESTPTRKGRARAREVPGASASDSRSPPAQASPHPKPDDAECGVVVEPVFGKPHPKSQVEKHLAKHLATDPELAPLFRWNHPIPVLGIGRTVDLFWEAGGLVIEIDGPSHLTAPQYNQDRVRDYRLLLDGYTTLRITNDAVNADVAVVIEQIRKVVRLIQNEKTRKSDESEPQAGTGALAHAHG